MSLFKHVKLPDTREAESVREYLLAQFNSDFSNSSFFFAEDVVFNGLLVQREGRKEVSDVFQDFVERFVVSIRLENVVEAGAKDRYLALYFIIYESAEQVVCDSIQLTGGKISRIDNVFSPKNTPKFVLDGQGVGAPAPGSGSNSGSDSDSDKE